MMTMPIYQGPYNGNFIGMHCSFMFGTNLSAFGQSRETGRVCTIGKVCTFGPIKIMTKSSEPVSIGCAGMNVIPYLNLYDGYVLELFYPKCEGYGFHTIFHGDLENFVKSINEIEFSGFSVTANYDLCTAIYPNKLMQFDLVDMMTMKKYSVPKSILDKTRFLV